MYELEAMLRPHLRALRPYQSARDDYHGQAEVWLDANENASGSIGLPQAYNRYPDPHARALRAAYAQYVGLPAESVYAGHGSDEVIDLLFRAYGEPFRDAVVAVGPTYGIYRVLAEAHGLLYREAHLRPGFQLEPMDVYQTIAIDTKMLLVCSPNNPTGNRFRTEDLRDILTHFRGLTILDEAYVEYSEEESLASLVAKFPRLIVLRTLSKAWGLAGLRVGFALAHPTVIRVLDLLKMPYHLNAPAQALALHALTSGPLEMAAHVASVRAERTRLAEALATCSVVEKVYPSDANFLLVKVAAPTGVYRHLAARGVIVRDRSRLPLCEGCLRITVGTPEENERLRAEIAAYDAHAAD